MRVRQSPSGQFIGRSLTGSNFQEVAPATTVPVIGGTVLLTDGTFAGYPLNVGDLLVADATIAWEGVAADQIAGAIRLVNVTTLVVTLLANFTAAPVAAGTTVRSQIVLHGEISIPVAGNYRVELVALGLAGAPVVLGRGAPSNQSTTLNVAIY